MRKLSNRHLTAAGPGHTLALSDGKEPNMPSLIEQIRAQVNKAARRTPEQTAEGLEKLKKRKAEAKQRDALGKQIARKDYSLEELHLLATRPDDVRRALASLTSEQK